MPLMMLDKLLTAVPGLYRILAIAGLAVALFGFGYYKGASHVQAELDAFQAQTEAAGVAQANHTALVVKEQKQTTQEVTNVYKARLDALNARYGRLHPSGSGSGSLPTIPSSSCGADAAAAYTSFVGDCAATTLMLESLQDWIRKQQDN